VNRYRFTGPVPVLPGPLGRWVEPGEVFTTDKEIIHPHFVPVKAKPKEAPDADN